MTKILNSASDFLTEVAKGQIKGHSIMKAMGEFESGNVDASGEDVCHWEKVGGPVRLPQPAAAGEQMTIVSTSTADNGVTATGVIKIRLEYLDSTGTEQIEDVTLNGTTIVNTVATDIRYVNDMHTLEVGSTGVSEGNITCYKTGESIATHLYNFIVLGGNKSLIPHRMIPIGKTLLLKAWHAEEAQSKRCAFRLRATSIHGNLVEGIFLFQGVTYLNGGASGELLLNEMLPELTILKVSYWSDAIGAEGSCGWWGILVNNEQLR